MSIEDIILDHDRRGISALRPHLPEDYCTQAAQVVLDSPGTAVVVTGFYILAAGAAETDGPPGAAVIGNALQSLGYDVVYVTDQHAAPVMGSIAGPGHEVVTFPITGEAESRRYSKELLDRLDPSVIIAIERCGLTADARYRNMHGQDISAHNAKIDYLLSNDRPSVGIGDGGNEIGMGNSKRRSPPSRRWSRPRASRGRPSSSSAACPTGADTAWWRPYRFCPAQACCRPWRRSRRSSGAPSTPGRWTV